MPEYTRQPVEPRLANVTGDCRESPNVGSNAAAQERLGLSRGVTEQAEASLRGAAAVESAFGRLAPGRAAGHAAWGDTEPGVVALQLSESALQQAEHPQFSYAAHETGHMLGLQDEYEGAAHGPSADGSSLAEIAGVEAPAQDRDTSSVMSKGMDVLPAHYQTFWEALTRMTSGYLAPSDWRIGR